jgi:hypothetical protein
MNDVDEDPKSRSNRVVLLPALFCVAWQALRMAPKTLVLGLLAAAFEEIGPTTSISISMLPCSQRHCQDSATSKS